MANQTFSQWRESILRSARDKKMLTAGHFELTGRCNLDCKMCYVHHLDHCAAKERELSTEQWKTVFDDAYDLGMQFFTLTGGECLLRPDFKELYLHLWNKRAMIDVLTNATLLNEEYVSFFKNHRPANIQVSLYGVSEEGYLRVTGHKGFEKAFSAIRALKDAGINVQVAVTPSSYIKDEYIQIIQLCMKNGLPVKPAEMVLLPNREDPTKDNHGLSLEEIIDLSIQQESLCRAVTPTDGSPEAGGPEVEPKIGLICTAGNCLCTVTWDGKMHPCASALVGGFDVRELGFAKAWQQTMAAAAKVILPVECEGCVYKSVCIGCPFIRSSKMDGHCDPQICELTRKLVEAGVKKLPE